MPPRRQLMDPEEIAQVVVNAMAAFEAARNNGLNPPTAKPCTYKDFMSCKPLSFKGPEGAVGLMRWIEKMESVFHICNCAEEDKVKFSTCTLAEDALSWWNAYAQTVGINTAYQLQWEELKRMIKEEYCPRDQLQQLEVEFWNLTVKNNDITEYTTRFHQLATLCPSMVNPEYRRIEKYITGLPATIQGMVTASKPGTIQSAVRMAHSLMAQVVRRETTTEKCTGDNKRKREESDDSPRQQLATVKAFVALTEDKAYKGRKPLCVRCDSHHEGPCGAPCGRCKRHGHQTQDCRVKLCFECGLAGHFKDACPQLNNNDSNDNENSD